VELRHETRGAAHEGPGLGEPRRHAERDEDSGESPWSDRLQQDIEIEDIALDGTQLLAAVDPPEGYEIVRVDVVVRLRQRSSSAIV